MAKFRVTVSRVTSREWEITVEAPDEHEAEILGLKEAYNHNWSMGEASYEVEMVEEV